MAEFNPEAQRAYNEALAHSQEAMDEQAARGSTQDGVLDAGIRAALQHAIDHLEPDLTKLEEALGIKMDAGSFLMGVQAAAAVMQRFDLVAVLRLRQELFQEYVEKARAKHGR